MNLEKIQGFVIESVLSPASLLEDEARAKACSDVTTGNARLSPAEQLDIYREQFWLRHTGALEEDFTSIAKLLGKDAFFELCAKYIEAHPPTSFTLRDLGEHFPAFIAKTEPWASDALLVDLAHVEWAFVTAFDAPDAPPLDPHKIAATPEEAWPAARLVIHPALRRLVLRYPAHELRAEARTNASTNDEDDTCASCDAEEAPLARPAAKDTWLVVFRGPGALQYIDIEEPAFVLLSELADGTPLGLACERTVAKLALDPTAFEAEVGRYFQSWTSWGWITDLLVP